MKEQGSKKNNVTFREAYKKSRNKYIAGHNNQPNGNAIQSYIPTGTKRMDICEQEKGSTETYMGKESNRTPMRRNQEQRRNVEKHNTGSRKRRYKGKNKRVCGRRKDKTRRRAK